VRLHGSSIYLRGISLFFILLTVVVTVIQVVQYSLSRSNYPSDMTIGNVPVGGLDPQAAAQRLLQVYARPVELHYGDAIIDMDPNLVGFQLDTESMLAAADMQRTGASFWGGYWDYLWNRRSPAREIPLVSSFSESRLRAYLKNEISSRYDQPSTPAQPIPGTANFNPGIPGQTMDIDRAVALIDSALQSPSQRTVILASQSTSASRPSLGTLHILLQQLIDQSGFDGLLDLYFLDLQTQNKIHFAYQSGQEISITPDIAFTASSTIKIPILVSVYQHAGGKLDDQTINLVQNMITESANAAADALMASLDEIRGPLVVTETMQALGLQNTFIAGYFAPGSFPLDHFLTPANTRSDINTDPDIYSQTTPSDIGILLEDIYQCSQMEGGTLLAVFPGQISQVACQQMLYFLETNKPVMLIKAGVPEGTVVANKYGYVADLNGIVNNISDAAIVFTPAGNYVLTMYAYHPVQALWNTVSPMFVELSRAVYNYYNLPSQ
jgi:beta-lactamase class A